ncbi:MAG: ATP-binding protein [Pseudomonadota bacterium]
MVSKDQSPREAAIREIVGRAISHDLKSPLLYFEDDIIDLHPDAFPDQERVRSFVDMRNDFPERVKEANNTFKDAAELLRDTKYSFENANRYLRKNTRPLVEGLSGIMERLVSRAESMRLFSSEKERNSIKRHRLNLVRLYSALETMTETDRSDTLEDVNLSATLERLFDASRRRETQVELETDLRKTITRTRTKPTIYTNRQKLISAMQNIVQNALRFASAEEEGKIFHYHYISNFGVLSKNTLYEDLRPVPKGDWICYHTLNTGKLIPQNYRPKLFDYGFTKGGAMDLKYGGGTGVGLAIAKLMIADLGGVVYLNEAEESYVDFCILLPMHRDNGVPEDQLFSTLYQ